MEEKIILETIYDLPVEKLLSHEEDEFFPYLPKIGASP